MSLSKTLLMALATLGLAMGACSNDPCESGNCEKLVTVAHTFDFAVEEEDGVSLGFDLDRRVSPDADNATCGHEDYRGPDGSEGVDNNASVLFESVAGFTETSVEELVRIAINDGLLLLMFELDGLDDPLNDDCVNVRIFQGKGTPFVGTDDFILDSQTFEVDEELPQTFVECAKLEDGVLSAGPFDGDIYISILRVQVAMRMHDAHFTAKLGERGIESMILGTALETEQLHDLIDQTMDGNLIGAGHFLVDALADMGLENNRCSQLSATLLLEAKPAFLF